MQEFIGKVTKGLFGTNSKSEHQAVYIETKQGRYVLRQQGGNPFYDSELQKLVGKTVRCSGVIEDYVMLISKYAVVNEEEDDRRNVR